MESPRFMSAFINCYVVPHWMRGLKGCIGDGGEVRGNA